MSKPPEIKVRPDLPEDKEWFEAAAAASKRSLNQWMLMAAEEKATRDGVARPPVGAKKKEARRR